MTSTRPAPTAPPAPPSDTEYGGVRAYGTQQNQAVTSDVRSYPSSASAGSTSGGGSDAVTMFQQFQQLQADLSELRGIVEEQGHLIAKLQANQKEQYLDLDRRVAALSGSPGAGAPSRGGVATGGVSYDGSPDGPTNSFGGAPVPSQVNGPSERDAYASAFELTKAKRFDDAIAAFNQLLVSYPHGEYAGNAYYWLGELYLALPEPNLDKSRQSFAQVVNQFPTNQKVSDAMYKLGVVYHRMGDRTTALEYLNRVQAQFPGTSAARLAQSYAAELR